MLPVAKCDQICLTSNMESGYSIIPAGGGPKELVNMSKANGIFSPPVHISPQPHFVREVPHQHPHHPKTRNSPTNPLKSEVKVWNVHQHQTWWSRPQGAWSSWECGIEHRRSECGQSASKGSQSSCTGPSPQTCEVANTIDCKIRIVVPFPPYVVLKNHVVVVHIPLLALQKHVE